MKIAEITKDSANVFIVRFVPNWLEKKFGVKEKTIKYKDSDSTYMSGGGTIYTRQDGSRTSNGNWVAYAIDKWRRSF